MVYKLIKNNPLYGKEGTLINSSLFKQLPNRHKELFIKADSNSKTNPHKQFGDGVRHAMEQIQAIRVGREVQGNRPIERPGLDIRQPFFNGIPDDGQNVNFQRVQFNPDEVEDEDDYDDDWDNDNNDDDDDDDF